MRVHFYTALQTPRDGQDLIANCGARVEKAVKVEVLEPGSDRHITKGPRDCRRCMDTNALRSRHYLCRVVASRELPVKGDFGEAA